MGSAPYPFEGPGYHLTVCISFFSRRGFRDLALALASAGLFLTLYPPRVSASLWDQTDFGMPLAAFRQAYPTARSNTPNAAASALPVVSYRLSEQTFDSLQGCDLEFSFAGAEPQLYRLQGQCRNSAEEIHRYLTGRYGTPTAVSSNMVVWRRGGVEVTFAPRSGVFTISDVERSKSVAAALMRLLGRVPVGPSEAPADGRTPQGSTGSE